MLHNLRIPLVVTGVLGGDSKRGATTALKTLERFWGCSIAGAMSGFFQLEVNFIIVKALVWIIMAGPHNKFHLNRTRVNLLRLSYPFHYIESMRDFWRIRDISVHLGLEVSPLNIEVLHHWDPLHVQLTGDLTNRLIVSYEVTCNDEALLRLSSKY